MTDIPLIRLTFNHPAMRAYFSDDTVGVRVRFDRGAVLFKPTINTDAVESLKLVARGSRGKQIILTGEMSEALLSTLTADNDFARHPYFTLRLDKQDWFRLEHYDEIDGAGRPIAPRLIPHVRLWIPKDGHYTAPVTTDELPEFPVMLRAFTKNAKQANSLIRKHSAQRKVGRPPVEVQRAKDFMANFSELYRTTTVEVIASA